MSHKEPGDLDELVSLAIRIDNRVRERQREKAGKAATTPSTLPRLSLRLPLPLSLFQIPNPCSWAEPRLPRRKDSAG